MDEERHGEERPPAEIGRDEAEQSYLGQERESALEPSEGVVRPDGDDD